MVPGFVESSWVAPFIELVETGEIFKGDVSVVFDAMIEESIALKTLFSVQARIGVDVETRQVNQCSGERWSKEYTSAAVGLRSLFI